MYIYIVIHNVTFYCYTIFRYEWACRYLSIFYWFDRNFEIHILVIIFQMFVLFVFGEFVHLRKEVNEGKNCCEKDLHLSPV